MNNVPPSEYYLLSNLDLKHGINSAPYQSNLQTTAVNRTLIISETTVPAVNTQPFVPNASFPQTSFPQYPSANSHPIMPATVLISPPSLPASVGLALDAASSILLQQPNVPYDHNNTTSTNVLLGNTQSLIHHVAVNEIQQQHHVVSGVSTQSVMESSNANSIPIQSPPNSQQILENSIASSPPKISPPASRKSSHADILASMVSPSSPSLSEGCFVFFCLEDHRRDSASHPSKIFIARRQPTVKDFASLLKTVFHYTTPLAFRWKKRVAPKEAPVESSSGPNSAATSPELSRKESKKLSTHYDSPSMITVDNNQDGSGGSYIEHEETELSLEQIPVNSRNDVIFVKPLPSADVTLDPSVLESTIMAASTQQQATDINNSNNNNSGNNASDTTVSPNSSAIGDSLFSPNGMDPDGFPMLGSIFTTEINELMGQSGLPQDAIKTLEETKLTRENVKEITDEYLKELGLSSLECRAAILSAIAQYKYRRGIKRANIQISNSSANDDNHNNNASSSTVFSSSGIPGTLLSNPIPGMSSTIYHPSHNNDTQQQQSPPVAKKPKTKKSNTSSGNSNKLRFKDLDELVQHNKVPVTLGSIVFCKSHPQVQGVVVFDARSNKTLIEYSDEDLLLLFSGGVIVGNTNSIHNDNSIMNSDLLGNIHHQHHHINNNNKKKLCVSLARFYKDVTRSALQQKGESWSNVHFIDIHSLRADLPNYMAAMSPVSPYFPPQILLDIPSKYSKSLEDIKRLIRGPKKVVSAFLYFCNEQRSSSDISPADFPRIVGEMWKNLSEEQKQKYRVLEAQDKIRFQQEKRAWEEDNHNNNDESYSPNSNSNSIDNGNLSINTAIPTSVGTTPIFAQVMAALMKSEHHDSHPVPLPSL